MPGALSWQLLHEKSEINVNSNSISQPLKSLKQKNSEVSIDISLNSPFILLVSPLIQREIIQRIYRYLSNGKTLSYESTCKLLSLIKEDIEVGRKEKIMQLDKELLAVRTGTFLQFRIDKIKLSEDVMLSSSEDNQVDKTVISSALSSNSVNRQELQNGIIVSFEEVIVVFCSTFFVYSFFLL